jgi:hypothetical protein
MPESNHLARRSSLPPPALADNVTHLGGYQILARLRSDAVGSEYLCCPLDEPSARCTLKVLRGRVPDDAASKAFLVFANRLAKLTHPRLLGVVDAGVHQQQPYLVHPYIDAVTLADLLTATAPEARPAGPVLKILDDVLEGLVAAHEPRQVAGESACFVHGALSSDHILVGPDGHALLAGVGEVSVLGPIAQDPGQDLLALRVLLSSALPGGMDENELRLRWFTDARKGPDARAAELLRELREMTSRGRSSTRPEVVGAWVRAVRSALQKRNSGPPAGESPPAPGRAAPAPGTAAAPARRGVFAAIRSWWKRRGS